MEIPGLHLTRQHINGSSSPESQRLKSTLGKSEKTVENPKAGFKTPKLEMHGNGLTSNTLPSNNNPLTSSRKVETVVPPVALQPILSAVEIANTETLLKLIAKRTPAVKKMPLAYKLLNGEWRIIISTNPQKREMGLGSYSDTNAFKAKYAGVPCIYVLAISDEISLNSNQDLTLPQGQSDKGLLVTLCAGEDGTGVNYSQLELIISDTDMSASSLYHKSTTQRWFSKTRKTVLDILC